MFWQALWYWDFIKSQTWYLTALTQTIQLGFYNHFIGIALSLVLRALLSKMTRDDFGCDLGLPSVICSLCQVLVSWTIG